MKHWILIVALGTLLVGQAGAGVLGQIDPSRSAEINGRMVDLPNANLNTLSFPNRDLPVSPVSSRQHQIQNMIEARTVKLRTLDRQTVETPTRSLPNANFTAKRAHVSDASVAGETIPTERADVPERIIRTRTPGEQQELMQQLNRRP